MSGTGEIHLTDQAFDTYDRMIAEGGSPIGRVEREIDTYLQEPKFKARYAEAFEAWREASEYLWSPDAEKHLTTIGHLCREAMQQFAAISVGAPSGVNPDPGRAQTVSRIRSALESLSSERIKAFLDALLVFWGTVSDLAQRQEHGGQKEGEPITLKDARRLVFQTGAVMFEIADALDREN